MTGVALGSVVETYYCRFAKLASVVVGARTSYL